MSDELRQRVVSGIVMAAVFLTAIFIGGWVFTLLIGVVSLVIWLEWSEMTLPGCDDRTKIAGLVAIGALILALMFVNGLPMALLLVAILAAAIGFFLSNPEGKYAVAGLLYASGFLVAMTMLRGSMDFTPGLTAILFLCFVVWFTDIGAYFAGRQLGGPKLAPGISPNKTISGAVGGLIAGMIGAALVVLASGSGNLGSLLFLALLMSAFSQCGDLFESWLKRRACVKDSGTFIPGHGGAMDRVDGLLFAAIFLWLVSALGGNLREPALTFFS